MKSGRLTCLRLRRNEQRIISGLQECSESLGAESLIGKSVRFRPDFYTTRIMPPSDWTGTIVEERRSSSGQDISSYIVLLDEPFRSQEPAPRFDATEDELEPF